VHTAPSVPAHSSAACVQPPWTQHPPSAQALSAQQVAPGPPQGEQNPRSLQALPAPHVLPAQHCKPASPHGPASTEPSSSDASSLDPSVTTESPAWTSPADDSPVLVSMPVSGRSGGSPPVSHETNARAAANATADARHRMARRRFTADCASRGQPGDVEYAGSTAKSCRSKGRSSESGAAYCVPVKSRPK
jgi:hypothetical protein